MIYYYCYVARVLLHERRLITATNIQSLSVYKCLQPTLYLHFTVAFYVIPRDFDSLVFYSKIQCVKKCRMYSKHFFNCYFKQNTALNQIDNNTIPFTLVIEFVTCKKNMSNGLHKNNIGTYMLNFNSKCFACRYNFIFCIFPIDVHIPLQFTYTCVCHCIQCT